MKVLIALIIFCSIGYFMMRPSKPTVIVLLGAPGAGKGTQSGYLIEKLRLPQVATGDLFRANLKNETALGQKAKSFMDKGQLVPDEVVLDMLFERIAQADCKKGFILDGFPRTVSQAEALDLHLKSVKPKVISLEISDDLLVERLMGRLVCSGCGAPYHVKGSPPKQEGICDRCGGKLVHRADDNEQVIKERLSVFHQQTAPVKDFYKSKGFLQSVDATQEPQVISNSIEKTLN